MSNPSVGRTGQMVVGAIALVLAFGVVKWAIRQPARAPSVVMPIYPAPTVTPIAPEPAAKAPSPVEQVVGLSRFADVLEIARGHMADTTDGPSYGSLLVAVWLGKRGAWSDVDTQRDETSIGKVKKDSDAERGKRMCVSGSIVQIAKDARVPGAFFGNLMTGSFNVVNFVSFGSTGELVEHSHVRFCGVVAGNYAFANVSGGETQSVQMAGVFDLPENRARR